MVMPHRFTRSHWRSPRGTSSLTIALVLLTCLGVVLGGASAVLASSHTRVPIEHPSIHGTMIACYDKKLGRYVDKTRPARCDIAGYAGETGKRYAAASVEGIKWGGWGRFRSKGALGVNDRTGTRVRVWAYRRMSCGDGRTFYSSANIVNLENGEYFWVHLPICDNPTPRH